MRKIGPQEIALASILGALSALCEIIPGPPFDIPFPPLPRISWDITGLPMMISLLLYGPMCAIYTCIVGCLIIFLRGNVYGGIFKVIAELATLLAFASLRRGVVVNSITAVTSRVAVMTIVNYYLLQLFYGMAEPLVVGLLPLIGLFNVTQALINIIPAYFIYLIVRTAYIKRC
ncbi:MAG: ECF transporter S component [Candidatus Bathyarchaeia archaeon]